MAQFNFAEKINNPDEWTDHIPFDEFAIEPTAVMTGDKNIHRFLIYQLKRSMVTAKGIDIIVSFLMESGVKMILNDLRNALDRNASIRILTGNYLGITQPSALYLIKNKRKCQSAISAKRRSDRSLICIGRQQSGRRDKRACPGSYRNRKNIPCRLRFRKVRQSIVRGAQRRNIKAGGFVIPKCAAFG